MNLQVLDEQAASRRGCFPNENSIPGFSRMYKVEKVKIFIREGVVKVASLEGVRRHFVRSLDLYEA